MRCSLNIKKNVTEIKRLFQERKEANQALLRFLISKGISFAVAEEILKEGGNLVEAIASRLRVTGDLNFDRPQKIALIGPTGVGKTTTLLKLAEYYLAMQKRIAVMTLDVAKKSFLMSWAEQNKIPFLTNVNTDVDLLLIDTEGCNYYLPHRIEELGEKMAAMGEDIEIVLTLSAAAKEVDLYGAVHQFSPLCPTSLAFTKLDETLASGVLVNVTVKSDLPIRYIAYGYPLPGEIQIADPQTITHKILTDFNREEFQLLRQLSL